MKSIQILLIIFIFCGCTDNRVSENFEYIDYSYASLYEGLTEIISLKIFKNGDIFMCNKYNYTNEFFYNFKLDRYQLDSISEMVKIICENKPDSILLTGSCDKCRAFNFIIRTKNRTLKINYYGEPFFDCKNYQIDKFVTYLKKIWQKRKKNQLKHFLYLKV